MNITFNKDTFLIIDKSSINFKDVEFNVVKFDNDIVKVKYLINFLTKELKGEIEYKNSKAEGTDWEYNVFAKQIKERQ